MTNRTTDLPEKTNLNANDLVTWLDSEDSNLSTKDKVFSIDNIWDKVFTDRTTDNLTEWATNLYLNETNLWNSTTIQNLQNDKADKSNVLELDNTTAYIPTADYHPATKNYVDNMSIPLATETTPWIVEKATTTEVEDGAADKYPDAQSVYNTYWGNKSNSVSTITLQTTSNWTTNSSSVLADANMCFNIDLSVSLTGTSTTASITLQYSDDNSTWNNAFNIAINSVTSVNRTFCYFVKKGTYIRLTTTRAWSWNSTWYITYQSII